MQRPRRVEVDRYRQARDVRPRLPGVEGACVAVAGTERRHHGVVPGRLHGVDPWGHCRRRGVARTAPGCHHEATAPDWGKDAVGRTFGHDLRPKWFNAGHRFRGDLVRRGAEGHPHRRADLREAVDQGTHGIRCVKHSTDTYNNRPVGADLGEFRLWRLDGNADDARQSRGGGVGGKRRPGVPRRGGQDERVPGGEVVPDEARREAVLVRPRRVQVLKLEAQVTHTQSRAEPPASDQGGVPLPKGQGRRGGRRVGRHWPTWSHAAANDAGVRAMGRRLRGTERALRRQGAIGAPGRSRDQGRGETRPRQRGRRAPRSLLPQSGRSGRRSRPWR